MANKAKGFKAILIILGLVGGAGVAYLVGRDMALPNGGGQSNPPVSTAGACSECSRWKPKRRSTNANEQLTGPTGR